MLSQNSEVIEVLRNKQKQIPSMNVVINYNHLCGSLHTVIRPLESDGLMYKYNQHTPCEATVLSCMQLYLLDS